MLCLFGTQTHHANNLIAVGLQPCILCSILAPECEWRCRLQESALEEFLFGTGSAVSRLLAKPDDNEEEQLSIADLVRQVLQHAEHVDCDGSCCFDDAQAWHMPWSETLANCMMHRVS